MPILPKNGYNLPSDEINWKKLKQKLKELTLKQVLIGLVKMVFMSMVYGWCLMLMIFMLMSIPELIAWVEDYLAWSDLNDNAIWLVSLIPLWWTTTGCLLCILIPLFISGQLWKKKPKQDQKGGDSNIH